jgi:hypothetical protein
MPRKSLGSGAKPRHRFLAGIAHLVPCFPARKSPRNPRPEPVSRTYLKFFTHSLGRRPPEINVEFYYMYEGDGPYYAGPYFTDENGNFQLYYGEEMLPCVGTYEFIQMRNADGGSWNDIQVFVEVVGSSQHVNTTKIPKTTK